jgi:hypothetical protein
VESSVPLRGYFGEIMSWSDLKNDREKWILFLGLMKTKKCWVVEGNLTSEARVVTFPWSMKSCAE